MKCLQCGGQLPETARFCGMCGGSAAVPEIAGTADPLAESAPDASAAAEDVCAERFTTPEERPAQPPGTARKTRIFVGSALALLALIAIFAAVLSGGGPYGRQKQMFLFPEDAEDTPVYYNGKVVILSGRPGAHSVSLDGGKAAVLTGERGAYTLWWLDGKTAQRVAENVYSFVLSDSGDAIAYIADYDNAGSGTLCLYRDGKNVTLRDDAAVHSVTPGAYRDYAYCVSPNGKTVAYVGKVSDTGELTSYLWDRRERELGQNCEPVCVSDGAKYVYYRRYNSGGDATLYVRRKSGDGELLCAGEPDSLYLNRNYSQMLFNYDNKLYLSRSGGHNEPIGASLSDMILPEDAQRRPDGGYTAIGVKDFKNTVYLGMDAALLRIGGQYDAKVVVSNITSPHMAGDGQTVTYMKNGGLYRINVLDKNAAPARLSGDVRTFAALVPHPVKNQSVFGTISCD